MSPVENVPQIQWHFDLVRPAVNVSMDMIELETKPMLTGVLDDRPDHVTYDLLLIKLPFNSIGQDQLTMVVELILNIILDVKFVLMEVNFLNAKSVHPMSESCPPKLPTKHMPRQLISSHLSFTNSRYVSTPIWLTCMHLDTVKSPVNFITVRLAQRLIKYRPQIFSAWFKNQIFVFTVYKNSKKKF